MLSLTVTHAVFTCLTVLGWSTAPLWLARDKSTSALTTTPSPLTCTPTPLHPCPCLGLTTFSSRPKRWRCSHHPKTTTTTRHQGTPRAATPSRAPCTASWSGPQSTSSAPGQAALGTHQINLSSCQLNTTQRPLFPTLQLFLQRELGVSLFSFVDTLGQSDFLYKVVQFPTDANSHNM